MGKYIFTHWTFKELRTIKITKNIQAEILNLGHKGLNISGPRNKPCGTPEIFFVLDFLSCRIDFIK